MKSTEYYLKRSIADSENCRMLAGAAIAQFLAMREGLKGRIIDGGLDATAASLTAAVISAHHEAQVHRVLDGATKNIGADA